MIIKTLIRNGEYYDSVKLMTVSKKISEKEGIDNAAVLMGTDLNKDVLKRTGLLSPEAENASPDDLIISVRGSNEAVVDKAISQVDTLLNQRRDGDEESDYRPKSFDSALKIMPDMNFCIISVPGRYARREAMKALQNGLHVLLFSDNVTLDEEIKLKKYAMENNLLLMGPDCGTAMINNVPLGFANKVRKGNIGIVGAAGTGMQEVMSLIHKQGAGISQAIGTGGRDLSAEVGGITMLQGLSALKEDDDTEIIVIISKPPAPGIAEKILDYVTNIKKPTVVNFIGGDPERIAKAGAVPAFTLEEAALKAVSISKGIENREIDGLISEEEMKKLARQEAILLNEDQKYIRGLYSGGTLCYESMLVLKDFVGDVHSNTPLNKKMKLSDAYKSVEHTCIDLGDDAFTVGRAHPMIDTALREEMFETEAQNPEVAVILLDIVIGYGTHPNPAEVFAKKIKKYKDAALQQGRHLIVISSVCGTEEDPQNLLSQQKILRKAGAIVMPSNAAAARLAGMIVSNKK
ncbi:acyl-CoA synthetase FdrA [Biomaibacter acetigenes]|uniref:Acyl-CoA synthetase FdrA n=1 Tax=Biomaibacter acetigenes TaxID=2316383 RepID=A0A3G2R4C6_9FIRM|nr:acyl-CoA synthetase FdrA [Biomaibacter acetigenes]AYO30185.1 acyl-CoA synthetase FdrA [Biomaibacter acetigenes]